MRIPGSSPSHQRFVAGAVVVAALAFASRGAQAQDPVRLPQVVIKAEAGHRISGVVRDTLAFLIEGVEVSIGALKRRTTTGVDGSFHFDSLPKGTYEVRARKIGYGPQIVQIKVENESGQMADFELVPIARALPAVVTSAARLGLSGVVADTSFASLAGAEVRVLATGLRTDTDSAGSFFLPAPAGKYMVTITKPRFRERVVSVSIPPEAKHKAKPKPSFPNPTTETVSFIKIFTFPFW